MSGIKFVYARSQLVLIAFLLSADTIALEFREKTSPTDRTTSLGSGRIVSDHCECLMGPAGTPGVPGVPGLHGSRGNDGTPGIKGSTGERGPQGETGPTGPVGPNGSRGRRGEPGTRGDKGDMGHPGTTGLKGSKGDTSPYLETRPRAAFSVARSQKLGPVLQEIIVTFDVVITNTGDCFDLYSSHFISKRNATYLFTTHIVGQNNKDVYAWIMKNDKHMGPLHGDGRAGYGTGSQTLVLSLKVDDHVWIQLSKDSALLNDYSTFSGVELFDD